MTRLTVKKILKAIHDKTGTKLEYMDLYWTEGFYYWSNEAGSIFSECCTYCQKLSDNTLEDWVKDFEYKLTDALKYRSGITLNEYIESIDWELKYE